MSIIENEAKLFNNLMEHNSTYYGYELSKGEIKIVLQAFEQLKRYRAISTVEECRALEEKSVAKKPIEGTDNDGYVEYYCPNCEAHLFFDDEQKFCNECGQAID